MDPSHTPVLFWAYNAAISDKDSNDGDGGVLAPAAFTQCSAGMHGASGQPKSPIAELGSEASMRPCSQWGICSLQSIFSRCCLDESACARQR